MSENRKEETPMVWSRGENGRQQTTTSSSTLLYRRQTKQRKTKENMDGQCERGFGEKKHRHQKCNGLGTRQSKMEDSSINPSSAQLMEGQEEEEEAYQYRSVPISTSG